MILKVKNNIEKWRILPQSMVGRNITIILVALSRFLYLFQNLPLFLTSKFFKQLDSIILPFVWSYKLPRISKAHLQKPVKMIGDNYVMKNSLRILKQIKSANKLPDVSVHNPICHNHSFLLSMVDGVFTVWRQSGLVTLKDVYIDKNCA